MQTLLGEFFSNMNDINEKKKSPSREKKEIVVSDLSAKFEKSKAVVFTNYQGLTHKQIEDLKKTIKTLNADFVVAKNTLIVKSFENLKLKIENKLEGPTGTMFIYEDIVEPLKAIAKTIKNLGLLNIKFGLLENKEITGDDLLRISTLPSREMLIAQFVGGLKSPILGLHRALNWNLQKFVMTLKAVETKKVGDK